MWKLAFLSLVIAVSSCQKNNIPWGSGVRNSFLDSCVPAAMKSGATGEYARGGCWCMQRGLERLYTEEEFSKVEVGMSFGSTPKEAVDVISACRTSHTAY